MRLTVQQLNADTTFLLTLFNTRPPTADSNTKPGADYTILIDPWLTGPSPIFHAYFAVSSHSTESAIQSLAELSKPPDLVIVSQPKNDHCNKGTLCTLPKSWKGTIVAVPAAAKKIRAWKHFPEEQIQVVPAYSAKNPATIIRLPLKNNSSATADSGKITIANIPEPYDVSAVHNVIGITIHPPPSLSTPTTPTIPPNPVSVLYTPHGLSPSSVLTPYLTHHLRPAAAYPIDLLFHSINIEANPKLMGGVVSNGAPGGVEIARVTGARMWVGAHDEEKDNGGLATKLIRCTFYDVEQVEGMLQETGVRGTRLHKLGVGEEVVIEVGTEEGRVGMSGDGVAADGMGGTGALLNGYG